MQRKRLVGLFVLLALGYVLYPHVRCQLAGPDQKSVGALQAFGVVQAEEILISGSYSGRIVALMAKEGESVQAGQPLAQLDVRLLDAQIAIAQADLDHAQAQLERALAGARAGQVSVAQAQLEQAGAAIAAANQSISDTILLRDHPQDLELQVALAQAQLQGAQSDLVKTQTQHASAADAMDMYVNAGPELGPRTVTVYQGALGGLPGDLPPDFVEWLRQQANGSYTWGDWEVVKDGEHIVIRRRIVVTLPLDAHLVPYLYRQSLVALQAAEQGVYGGQTQLAHLYELRDDPVEAESRIHQAQAALAQAQTVQSLAQAQLDGYLAGASPEQIAVAQAQVAQKQAALDVLVAQKAMMTLKAPSGGVILGQIAQVYELVGAGAPVFALADLEQMSLRVYVPANRLAEVYMGQPAQVRVDSYPGRDFEGTVTHIADQPEFTPRNVATKEERVNTVYAVEICLLNPDGALKPGMPADVVFGR